MRLKTKCVMTEEINRFKTFVSDNYRHILTASILLLLVYGGWLFNADPRIDTEVFINAPYSVYNWLLIGRQGMVSSELIFGLWWFNPYFAILAGFLFLCINGVFLGYLISRIGHVNGIICSYLALMIFCSPIMTEQFYFTLQIFEIAWGYILSALMVGLSYYGILTRSIMARTVSVIGMIWLFSTYQSFTVVYVVLVIFLFVLLYERWEFIEERRLSTGKYISIIGQHIMLFVSAFIINSLVTKILFSQSAYLGAQRHWGKEPAWQCVKNIFRVIGGELTGKGNFYTGFFGAFSAMSILIAIMHCYKRKTKTCWIYAVAMITLQFCPFLMNIYLGGEALVRSELSYPIVLAFNITFCMVCAIRVERSKLPLAVVCIMAVVCIWMQAGITMRFIYTDNVRAQEDRKLAMQLEIILNGISNFDKPVAFIGGYSCKLNNACLRDGITSNSVFNWDTHKEPHYSVSTSRSVGMLNMLGIPAQRASNEQIFEARKAALELPVWPDYNSVKDMGDYVVIKLADDLWIEDLVDVD